MIRIFLLMSFMTIAMKNRQVDSVRVVRVEGVMLMLIQCRSALRHLAGSDSRMHIELWGS